MPILPTRGRLRAGALAVLVLGLAAAAPAQARAATHTARVCGPVEAGFVHCDALAASRHRSKAHAAAAGGGYGPADLQSAYGLTSAADAYGSDQTVAIVDAYDLPTAEADLATYRSNFGLPPCTSESGCFRKVDQGGGTSYPPYDPGWGAEIALDLDMVSAVCPHCHILLVEASSNSSTNVGAAVNRAATMGATQISNSYGGNEYPGETTADTLYYRHPGVALTASSGDSGYGVEYPAASPYVIGVGGTSLLPADNPRGWTETAWSGAGSGCSAYEPKPAWQQGACAHRAVADVSAVADPATSLAAYDQNDGWMWVGGTSVSAPIVAGAYALTGAAAAVGSFAYDHPDWFNDVTSGSNGSCALTYLCTAMTGFDGPTGIGTPSSAHPGTPAPPPDDGGGAQAPSEPAPSPPPAAAAPAAPVRSSLAVSASPRAVSRGGGLSVRVSCGGGPSCLGVLTLRARLGGSSARWLGGVRFSIAPRQSASVRFRLSRANLRRLERRGRTRVYGTASDSDGTVAQASFLLRAPRLRRP